jgi:hypothetical protein
VGPSSWGDHSPPSHVGATSTCRGTRSRISRRVLFDQKPAGMLPVVAKELARLKFAVDIRVFEVFASRNRELTLCGISEVGRSMPKKKRGPASSMPLSSVCFQTECGTDWTGLRKTRFCESVKISRARHRTAHGLTRHASRCRPTVS